MLTTDGERQLDILRIASAVRDEVATSLAAADGTRCVVVHTEVGDELEAYLEQPATQLDMEAALLGELSPLGRVHRFEELELWTGRERAPRSFTRDRVIHERVSSPLRRAPGRLLGPGE